MTQYQNQNDQSNSTKKPVDTKTLQMIKDIQLLRQRIDDQNKDIDNMLQTIKRLQNELRTAVNMFNSKNHG
jgi:hypothetical protein